MGDSKGMQGTLKPLTAAVSVAMTESIVTFCSAHSLALAHAVAAGIAVMKIMSP